MSLAAHERKSKDGTSDIWLTPRWIIHALGPFDLDPCAAPSPRPHSTALHHVELPEDGLRMQWDGRVWLNPPYSDADPWLKKMSSHRNGIALIFARVETQSWQRWVFPFCDSIFFPSGRIAFCLPDGTKKIRGWSTIGVCLLFGCGYGNSPQVWHRRRVRHSSI